MNALVPVSAPALSFADIERMGTYIAKSRLFGLQTPEQAIALMLIAQAEGRHPAEAARDYDIIQNRPAKKSEAMMRDFLQGGGKVEWHTLDDAKADATFSHPQGGKVRISWDLERAQKAGLGGKSNWKAFPRQMLRSRCVSEGVRTVWPMATSGMYVPEETREMEPMHAGPTIDAEPEKPSAREAFNATTPMEPPKKLTLREWIDEFRRDTEAAQTQEEATPILDRALAMSDFLATRPAALAQYDSIRNACITRLWAEPPAEEDERHPLLDDDLPPVEIRGEAHLAAG